MDYLGQRTDTGREWPKTDIFGRKYNRVECNEHGVGMGRFVVYPAAASRAVVDARLAEIRVELAALDKPKRKRKESDDETN